MGVRFHLDSEEHEKNFLEYVAQMRLAGKRPCVEFINAPGTRTGKQNAALHLFLRRLAVSLNDAGYDQLTFPWREGMEIPFTETSVKAVLWSPTEEAMFGHTSTTQAGKMEYSDVYEALCRALIQKLDGYMPPPWPQEEI